MKDFQVRFIDANRPDTWVRQEELNYQKLHDNYKG